MLNFFKITETTVPYQLDDSIAATANKITITNTSNKFIRDITLINSTSPSDAKLISQYVVRARGSMSFPPTNLCLELGNLEENESLSIVYEFIADIPSLTSNFRLLYTLDDDNTYAIKISDYISPEGIQMENEAVGFRGAINENSAPYNPIFENISRNTFSAQPLASKKTFTLDSKAFIISEHI